MGLVSIAPILIAGRFSKQTSPLAPLVGLVSIAPILIVGRFPIVNNLSSQIQTLIT